MKINQVSFTGFKLLQNQADDRYYIVAESSLWQGNSMPLIPIDKVNNASVLAIDLQDKVPQHEKKWLDLSDINYQNKTATCKNNGSFKILA